MKFLISVSTLIALSGCVAAPETNSCCECAARCCPPKHCGADAPPPTGPPVEEASVEDPATLPPVASQWSATDSDTQLQALEEDLRRLEKQREYERGHHKKLEDAINVMTTRVAKLNSDVDHWRQEVTRLEEESLAQHTLDLESLQKINSLVEQFPPGQINDER